MRHGILVRRLEVLMEDGMKIQPAQNLVPAANTEFIEDNEEVADLLNEISATLTR